MSKREPGERSRRPASGGTTKWWKPLRVETEAGASWTVVDDEYVEHDAARSYLRWLHFGADRSVLSVNRYAGALSFFFTWSEQAGVDWHRVGLDELSAFMSWCQYAPAPGLRSTAGSSLVLGPGAPPVRAPQRVNFIITVVTQFLEYQAVQGVIAREVVERLRMTRRSRPVEGDLRWSSREPQVRRLRLRTTSHPPRRLTPDEIRQILDVVPNERDRFLIIIMWRCGLRISEALGLHRRDMHLLPDSTHLGCDITRSHVHVVRRRDNANGALAKSRTPRVVPAPRIVVEAYRDYLWRRDSLGLAESSKFVFVNLYRSNAGTPMKVWNAQDMVRRAGARSGVSFHAHMLRHTFGSDLAEKGTSIDVIRTLMGHASIRSTQVYLHPSWDACVEAVEMIAARS